MNVIIGATGRTGRAIVAELARTKEKTRVVTRDARRGAALARRTGADLEVVEATLDDVGALRTAMRGARAVSVILPDDLGVEAFHAGRRAMAGAMAQAIQLEKVPRVIVVSSSTAALGPEAKSGFGRDLARFECHLAQTGACVTALRAPWFFDNLVVALPFAQHEGIHLTFFEKATVPIPGIAAADVGVLAARALLASPARSEIVDLLGAALTVGDMVNALAIAAGRAVQLVDLPPGAREAMLRTTMSDEAATALRETCACIGAGVPLAGDRRARGWTSLDAVLGAAANPPVSARATDGVVAARSS